MHTEKLIHELSNGLIGWYPFRKDGKALCILDDAGAFLLFADYLREKELEVKACSLDELIQTQSGTDLNSYDYIICANALEYSMNPVELLGILHGLLNNAGRLFIVADNRLAIRYFCGDKDAYTGHVLDGIDNYVKVSSKRREEIRGRAYSKSELKDMLSEAGFEYQKFYSVMPSISRPQVLISEDYIPKERQPQTPIWLYIAGETKLRSTAWD